MKAYAHSFKQSGPTYYNSNNPRHKNSSWWSDRATEKDLKKQINGLFGLTQFTQADVRTSLQGNLSIMCSSLYPLEQGFTLPLNYDGPIADKILDSITGFGKARINFIQGLENGPGGGYWNDLQKEYDFQKAHSGKVKKIHGKRYRYQFVNSYEEIERLESSGPQDVQNLAIINTIEGAHCFGSGLPPFDLPQRIGEILERARFVKEEWEHPPFFITLAHHFNNEFCGHAKSLGPAAVLLNQRPKLNTGFTKEGKQLVHLLLDEKIGRRVLIDVKHMSLKARRQYYQLLQDYYACNIPIIVSHGCVTGSYSKIRGKRIPSIVSGKPHKKFHSGDINFFDFELINIKRSHGIFGIQLDERRIASAAERRKTKKVDPRQRLLYSAKLVWNQMQHIAEVLDNEGLFAWDIQSLGSDFDGIINPIDGCFTAEYYQNLAHFLLVHAKDYVKNEMANNIKYDINRIDAEEIVTRFLSKNAADFLQKHFRTTEHQVETPYI